MPVNADRMLPVIRVGEIPSDDLAERWLVEQLWCANAVGVIGGAPKCAKTWLGLDMALSVATGTPCLGKYAVPEPGPVLVYLAEDALRIVGERIEGMARHRGLDIAHVAIYAITASALRLDQDRDRTRLWETARWLRPKLLVLDPLVRLHGIDENHAGAVAELLAYFRSLQRELGISVLLVHHTRKNAGDGAAAGQGLRGSSDIHAFGDSNLYLRRTEQHLILSSEHRSASASAPVYLELVATNEETTHLEVIADFGELSRAALHDEKADSLTERVLALLARGRVLTRTTLRDSLAVKNERLGEVLESLERAGQIGRTAAGWRSLC
jgi:AAA domain